jgi:hypothetical protein
MACVLLCLAALALAPGLQVAAEGEPRWPIGLTARRVGEVPADELLASKTSPILNGSPAFEVEESGGVIEVHIHRSDGYAHDSVCLRLDPDGARASASSGSCTHAWKDAILGGTTCLVSDGTRAALDFELYDGAEAAYAQAYFGRIQLGAPGSALAEAVLARERSAEPLRLDSHLHAPAEFPFAEDRRSYTSHGLVDGFGRRQGLWTVRESESDTVVLEMTWRDGRPDGVYRRTWPESSSVGALRMGFEDGEHLVWHSNGERRVMRFAMGLKGEDTLYDAEGRRRREVSPQRRREWSSEGRLVADKRGPDWLFSIRRGHAAHLEWIGQLYTRRTE